LHHYAKLQKVYFSTHLSYIFVVHDSGSHSFLLVKYRTLLYACVSITDPHI